MCKLLFRAFYYDLYDSGRNDVVINIPLPPVKSEKNGRSGGRLGGIKKNLQEKKSRSFPVFSGKTVKPCADQQSSGENKGHKEIVIIDIWPSDLPGR